jgi:hypothetical protein
MSKKLFMTYMRVISVCLLSTAISQAATDSGHDTFSLSSSMMPASVAAGVQHLITTETVRTDLVQRQEDHSVQTNGIARQLKNFTTNGVFATPTETTFIAQSVMKDAILNGHTRSIDNYFDGVDDSTPHVHTLFVYAALSLWANNEYLQRLNGREVQAKSLEARAQAVLSKFALILSEINYISQRLDTLQNALINVEGLFSSQLQAVFGDIGESVKCRMILDSVAENDIENLHTHGPTQNNRSIKDIWKAVGIVYASPHFGTMNTTFKARVATIEQELKDIGLTKRFDPSKYLVSIFQPYFISTAIDALHSKLMGTDDATEDKSHYTSESSSFPSSSYPPSPPSVPYRHSHDDGTDDSDTGAHSSWISSSISSLLGIQDDDDTEDKHRNRQQPRSPSFPSSSSYSLSQPPLPHRHDDSAIYYSGATPSHSTLPVWDEFEEDIYSLRTNLVVGNVQTWLNIALRGKTGNESAYNNALRNLYNINQYKNNVQRLFINRLDTSLACIDFSEVASPSPRSHDMTSSGTGYGTHAHLHLLAPPSSLAFPLLRPSFSSPGISGTDGGATGSSVHRFPLSPTSGGSTMGSTGAGGTGTA